MQCARCHGALISERRVGTRPKRRYPAPSVSPNNSKQSILFAQAEWMSMVEESRVSAVSESPGFFHLYSRSIAMCGVTGFLCAAFLFFLSFSVLHAGAVALPFLGFFAVGFVLSIGLPFKMYREYRLFRG